LLVDINLLPDRDRERSKAVILSLVILLSAMLFWLTFFVMANRNADEAERLDARTQEIRLEGAEIRSRMQGTETMADREQLELTVGWAESYQFPTAPLLRHLVSLLPARGFIMDYTYTGPHTADLTVQFDRYEQAAYYLARLKSATPVDSAILNDVSAVPLDEETDDEGNPVETDDMVVPRYTATYTIEFVDPRVPAEGTAEEPAEGGEETEDGTDTEVNVDNDVDVNVEQEDSDPSGEAPGTGPDSDDDAGQGTDPASGQDGTTDAGGNPAEDTPVSDGEQTEGGGGQ
jgi:type IV pilus assembly protein PilN